MPPVYTYALASSIALLAALQVPFPVEISSLALVGVVIRWLIGRENSAHEQHDKRIADLEEQVERNRKDLDQQRHLKHAWRNEVTAMRATIGVLAQAAKRCSCGTMEPLLPVLNQLATDVGEPE